MDKIILENVRGLNKTIPLHNRTLLLGGNGSGKTTILEALGFALTGAFGNLSKKDGDVWAKVATGDQMKVKVFEKDNSLVRQLTRTGKTTKHSGSINHGVMHTKSGLIGAIENTVFDVELVSLSSFWSLSDAKKIADLSKFYTGDAITSGTINDSFPKEFQAKDNSLFDLLIKIEDKIKKQKSSSASTIKSSEGNIKALSAQKNEIECPAGNLNEIQKEIDGLNQTLLQINRNTAEAVKNKTNFTAWQEETRVNGEAIKQIHQENSHLKDSKIYNWEINRCRDEEKKALRAPNEQLLNFAQKMLDAAVKIGCTTDAKCKSCPLIMAPKMQVKKCKPQSTDFDALKEELEKFKKLRDAAKDIERLDLKRISLLNDPRSKLITDKNIEAHDAVESMNLSINSLLAKKELLTRSNDLDISIEKIRLEKIKAAELLEKTKDSEKTLKKTRKELTTAIFGPIKKAVDNHIPSKESFFGFDANDNLLIGWKLRDTITPRDSLSSGEQAQFDVAMALGIIDIIDNDKQKIITIEAAEIDKENLVKFCDSLQGAPSGVQIIAATWVQDKEMLNSIRGFEFVNLEY